MNRFVFALAVTLVLGMVGVSRAQCGCQLNDYTPGHTAGSYWTTGCCRYRDCPISCGQVAPSFPPGPGPLTITMPGLMPPTLIVSPPMPSPPPSSEGPSLHRRLPLQSRQRRHLPRRAPTEGRHG